MVVGRFRHLLHRTGRAAGVIIINPEGRLLMVHDRVRREWSYPAGFVEEHETPLAGAVREIGEEVNIHLSPDRLERLATHTLNRPLGRLEFTTFRAAITAAEAAAVRLQFLEITDHRWVTQDQALELSAPRFRPRLRELLSA